MRIFHALRGLDAGGVENLALQLISHAPSGIEHYLVNVDARRQELRPRFDVLVGLGHIKIIDLFFSDRFFLACEIYLLCRRLRPDALLIYPCNRPMLWFALGARLAGVRRLAVSVGNTAPLSESGRRVWERTLTWFAKLGVLPVPCSRAVKYSLRSLCLPKGFRFGPVIANGCDTIGIAQRAAAARATRPLMDPFRIVMVARLDCIKDQSTLLRAFAVTQMYYPACQLQLVGDGPDRKQLEALAFSLGLDPHLVFLGLRSDIPELLGHADIFAFSTTSSEGFGIALIEAMAASLPIVASDVPACREVLLDGAAGDLLPPGDVPAWTKRLCELLASHDQRQFLSSKSISHSSLYDIRESANCWFRLLGFIPSPS